LKSQRKIEEELFDAFVSDKNLKFSRKKEKKVVFSRERIFLFFEEIPF